MREEGVAAAAVTESGATRGKTQCVFLPKAELFSRKHPVIWHLTILSAHTICKPSQPLTLYYSPITKELLLILAFFPLLGCVCVCADVMR